MSPVVLQGPCKSHVSFEIIGILKADTNVNSYTERTWFQLLAPELSMDKAQVFGDRANVATTLNAALNSHLEVKNAIISGFTSLNPPVFHMHVVGCNNFTVHGLTNTAPGYNPNTDGMHISASCNVTRDHRSTTEIDPALSSFQLKAI
ncbi:hypothetical protein Dsin_025462 [Dipteronia sinensis]|uniref:Uncharacterized protein n=1 Tax=Dipteronia sinensis TaxID=43782 RepID=A0AAD9ZVW1_9ROSI|nr:hypothetical protein Dsin_025462 [Dipteronia sinensis]